MIFDLLKPPEAIKIAYFCPHELTKVALTEGVITGIYKLTTILYKICFGAFRRFSQKKCGWKKFGLELLNHRLIHPQIEKSTCWSAPSPKGAGGQKLYYI